MQLYLLLPLILVFCNPNSRLRWIGWALAAFSLFAVYVTAVAVSIAENLEEYPYHQADAYGSPVGDFQDIYYDKVTALAKLGCFCDANDCFSRTCVLRLIFWV